ncbi:MAG: 5'/3'-nucleotidase SurE [Anaerolineae bacterium]|nr:5'/3'-nucleotidase SurE [Anaerolineae bacterium]
MKRPLILLTNDDGIISSGLWAIAEVLLPVGEILIVAPDRQWSGAGRGTPKEVTGRVQDASRVLHGWQVTAYAVDASPALAVEHAMLEFVPRRPDLVVSGVNFGANLGIEVTVSGTVGAALEAAAFGIPALAISLEMDSKGTHNADNALNYAAAQSYTERFARHVLCNGLPYGVDVLNINLPEGATRYTAWRYTYLSRYRYFEPLPPDRSAGPSRPRYELIGDPTQVEPRSDLYTLLVDRLVSVTPLTLDLTAPINPYAFEQTLTMELLAYQAVDALPVIAPESLLVPMSLD